MICFKSQRLNPVSIDGIIPSTFLDNHESVFPDTEYRLMGHKKPEIVLTSDKLAYFCCDN
jgi:hypothetical protein